jgi:hypothetical protein
MRSLQIEIGVQAVVSSPAQKLRSSNSRVEAGLPANKLFTPILVFLRTKEKFVDQRCEKMARE